jgi:hypothetical protein
MLIGLLCGICFLVGVAVFFYLSRKQNILALELSYIIVAIVYVGLEILLGIYSILLTTPMIVLVFLLLCYEAIRPLETFASTTPEQVKSNDQNILCIRQGKDYRALSAIRITSLPQGKESPWRATIERSSEENHLWMQHEELRWLIPFWEEDNRSKIVYTVDSKIERGTVALYVFMSVTNKDKEVACDYIQRSQQVVISWLTRKEYEFSIVDANSVWKEYVDLNLAFEFDSQTQGDEKVLALLSLEGIPRDPSNDMSQLLRKLCDTGIKGHLHISFESDKAPRLPSVLRQLKSQEQQPNLPYKMESHQLRGLYAELNDVEACEGTGTFQVSTHLLVENISSSSFEQELKRIRGAINSVWKGVKVTDPITCLKTRQCSEIALRNYQHSPVRTSGARLSSLLNISEGIQGIMSHFVPPEYSLPSEISPDVDSLLVGGILNKGTLTGIEFRTPTDSVVRDVGLYGNPGGGKTNTGFVVTKEVSKKNIPFLVIVPAKHEWRILADHISDVRIFPTRSIRFNFLDVPENVDVSTHINNIATCFTAWWPSEGILVQHITKVFQRAYINAGWDLYSKVRGTPILITDLYEAMEEIASELRYGSRLNQDFLGALTARFETLINDPILSVMFNCEEGLSVSELLNNRIILELNDLPDMHKALVTSLLLVSVTEYLKANIQPNMQKDTLRHLLVLEEAHHVLKNVATSNSIEGHGGQQQAINAVVQLLRESRGLGLGIVLIDQLPAMLAPEAVKLAGTTIIHAIFDTEERLLVGNRANLSDDQIRHIGYLKCGEAIIHQGFKGVPVHVRVRKYPTEVPSSSSPWTDERVEEHMDEYYKKHPHLLEVNVPAVKQWKPDEDVLSDIMYVVDGNDFLYEFNKRMDKVGEDYAHSYVRGLIRKVLARNSDSPIAQSEISSYLGVVLESISEKTDIFDSRSAIDDTSRRESFA